MKAMIATTFDSANQNSNSPYLATLNRLDKVSKAVMAKANAHVSMPGNQVFRIAAAAIASSGITSTQNHQ
ncbi:hypothetical protein D3C76_1621320 [compost metagenome]